MICIDILGLLFGEEQRNLFDDEFHYLIRTCLYQWFAFKIVNIYFI